MTAASTMPSSSNSRTCSDWCAPCHPTTGSSNTAVSPAPGCTARFRPIWRDGDRTPDRCNRAGVCSAPAHSTTRRARTSKVRLGADPPRFARWPRTPTARLPDITTRSTRQPDHTVGAERHRPRQVRDQRRLLGPGRTAPGAHVAPAAVDVVALVVDDAPAQPFGPEAQQLLVATHRAGIGWPDRQEPLDPGVDVVELARRTSRRSPLRAAHRRGPARAPGTPCRRSPRFRRRRSDPRRSRSGLRPSVAGGTALPVQRCAAHRWSTS